MQPVFLYSFLRDPAAKNSKVSGLDTLRIAALVLITWQHAASALGFYAHTQWRSISPGQTGVAMFCAISGYLAFRTVPNRALSWFWRRLCVLFPSYWIVTVLAFVLTWISGSRPVTLGLFASQMLGMGYFTHGWELVNVVSWFLSLILLCYALSLAAWRSGRPAQFWLLVAGVAAILVATRIEVPLCRHVLAFAFGALYNSARISKPLLLIALLAFFGGMVFDPQFFYAGFALLALALAVCGAIWEAKFFIRASTYSYEYFLVHGICLVAITKYVVNGFLSIPLAIGIAAAAAVTLHVFEQRVATRFREWSKARGNR